MSAGNIRHYRHIAVFPINLCTIPYVVMYMLLLLIRGSQSRIMKWCLF